VCRILSPDVERVFLVIEESAGCGEFQRRKYHDEDQYNKIRKEVKIRTENGSEEGRKS
jgi:hypothetical protein